MTTKEKYKLVYIIWEDSYSGARSWTELDELEPTPVYLISVGYLVHDKNNCKVIVPHISHSDDHERVCFSGQGEMTIPNSCIKYMTELKQPKFSPFS